MALPNTSMNAIPLTTLTSDFVDDMIENIDYLASIVDGSDPTGPDGWNILPVVPTVTTQNGQKETILTYAATSLY